MFTSATPFHQNPFASPAPLPTFVRNEVLPDVGPNATATSGMTPTAADKAAVRFNSIEPVAQAGPVPPPVRHPRVPSGLVWLGHHQPP